MDAAISAKSEYNEVGLFSGDLYPGQYDPECPLSGKKEML